MEIRDVIHGSIQIEPHEISIIASRFFQRLRQIRQLGFADASFPSATHNRYIHSLGAMETASQMLDSIFLAKKRPFELTPAAYARFRAVLRLAALLHDVGHGPLSHTTEFAMPLVEELKIPGMESSSSSKKKATHEDYTLKMILDSELSTLIRASGLAGYAGSNLVNYSENHVAALIDRRVVIEDDFFIDQEIDFRPILQQIISSELDADRMDYLRRDSLHAGVSYGQFDSNWLLSNLTAHLENNKCYLGLQQRAIYAFEDFLISRFHMFLMVYFHYESVIYEEMLAAFLTSPDCDYHLPADIERYLEFNDGHLYAHLARSTNPWAQRISQKKPYQMLVEIHSGIPAKKSSQVEHEELLKKVTADLERQKIHYIMAQSTSELSKYFGRLSHPGKHLVGKPESDPIFVKVDNHYSQPSFIPLEQCTDLFQRYSEKRSITRLYIAPENYQKVHKASPAIAAENPVLSKQEMSF